MDGAQAIVLGSVLGIVGALPSAFLFERAIRKDAKPGVAAGLASTMVSFVVLSAAVFVVWLVERDAVLPFGAAEAVSFLLLWAVEAGRAWRDAQRGARPGERKHGESAR